ncbi:MAG: hypothetical protein A2X50_09250 [Candidatus Rokubacteria bacterium GWF2_70_14]|nr:MAG: hypothetical protein A2X50_09250 [Candidatus Rokubacteria bacterium GWF2_70_14]
MPRLAHVVPRSRTGDRSPSGTLPRCEAKKPCGPSKTVAGPRKPWRPSAAATSPLCAAQPGCRRLSHDSLSSRIPAAWLPQSPSALTSAPSGSPARRAATAAQANVPQSAVGWKPRSWKAPGAAPARRQPSSRPTTSASSMERPSAPAASPAASAAASAGALAWYTASTCVSSKSRPWARVPFTSAAEAAGSRVPNPSAVLSWPAPSAHPAR